MGSNNPQNNVAGALTFPSSSQDNSQSVPLQPRQPRNLQGLLRFAMDATKVEDDPRNSELGPVDEERRRFLEEALKSLTVDIAEVLRNAIQILSDSEKIKSIQLGQTLPGEVKLAFHSLFDYIDDMDIANDFYKLGGFAVFPICYSSENDEVRANANSLLAELCQNNPFCQARALESGLLNILLNLVQIEQGNALTKCIYAISCATRNYPAACAVLCASENGGVEVICGVLRAERHAPLAARTKAAFLLRFLAQHYPPAKQQFIEENLVRTIVEQIKLGRDEGSEHLLSVLMVLVEGLDPIVLQQCRDPSLKLRNILEEHLKHPDLRDDTYLEEKEYCGEILRIVFDGYKQEEVAIEEIADR